MEVVAGIDIGGSHIGIGFLPRGEGGLLLEQHLDLDNTLEPSAILNQVILCIKDILASNPSWEIIAAEVSRNININGERIGIGCPGHCKNGVLMAASNLPTFKQVPIAKIISEAFNGITTVLLNDADAAIAAEVWDSATSHLYRDCTNIAMIMIGTGVGLGLILNGQLYHGSNGLVEGGHMILTTNSNRNRKCNCGQVGCIELTTSAKMTALRYTEKSSLCASESSKSLINTNHGIGTEEVFDRASKGDEIAIEVLEETAGGLALLSINICRVLDPDVIIFGGGMARAGDVLIRLIQKHIDMITWTVQPTSVKLVTAHSVERAGILGAAQAASHAHSGKKW